MKDVQKYSAWSFLQRAALVSYISQRHFFISALKLRGQFVRPPTSFEVSARACIYTRTRWERSAQRSGHQTTSRLADTAALICDTHKNIKHHSDAISLAFRAGLENDNQKNITWKIDPKWQGFEFLSFKSFCESVLVGNWRINHPILTNHAAVWHDFCNLTNW